MAHTTLSEIYIYISEGVVNFSNYYTITGIQISTLVSLSLIFPRKYEQAILLPSPKYSSLSETATGKRRRRRAKAAV